MANKIDTLFVFVALDSRGDDDYIMSMQMPNGAILPFVSSTPEGLEMLSEAAKNIDCRYRVIKFTCAEDITKAKPLCAN